MNYNYIAPYYDILSKICFFNRQQQAHLPILKYLKDGDTILWIGGGSGLFLKDLNKLNINLSIDYVEMSSIMINISKQNHYNNLYINYINKDIFEFYTEKKYNCILTAFLFDHFSYEKSEILINRLSERILKNGFWFFVDFNEKQNLWQKTLTRLMIVFFKIVASTTQKDFPKIQNLFKDYTVNKTYKYFKEYIVTIIYVKK